jgi:hypothetical protein
MLLVSQDGTGAPVSCADCLTTAVASIYAQGRNGTSSMAKCSENHIVEPRGCAGTWVLESWRVLEPRRAESVHYYMDNDGAGSRPISGAAPTPPWIEAHDLLVHDNCLCVYIIIDCIARHVLFFQYFQYFITRFRKIVVSIPTKNTSCCQLY